MATMSRTRARAGMTRTERDHLTSDLRMACMRISRRVRFESQAAVAPHQFSVLVRLEDGHRTPTELAEIERVLKPGGAFCASVPRSWPERICWTFSREYHDYEGGHLRIFNARELRRDIESFGFRYYHRHWAHALHAPFWWLKCLLWESRESNVIIKLYHRLLVWDIVEQPWLTQTAEKLLNPLMGKSLVMYFRKEGPA